MEREFRFSIKEIELIEKSINSVVYVQDVPFNFEVKIEIRVDADMKFTRHIISIDIRQGENPEKVASMKLACVFSVPNLADYEKDEQLNQKIPVPEDLILLLNTVTIGTARGVLFSEFRGTFLSDALLPVIDPTGFKSAERP